MFGPHRYVSDKSTVARAGLGVFSKLGGAVAAGVATKVMPKGMKRKLQRRKSWVNRKSKRCEDKCPCLVRLVSLLNGVVSLALSDVHIWTGSPRPANVSYTHLTLPTKA